MVGQVKLVSPSSTSAKLVIPLPKVIVQLVYWGRRFVGVMVNDLFSEDVAVMLAIS